MRRATIGGMRRASIVSSLRARQLCSTASTGPLLPKWGSFGKSADEIAKLEERIRDDGDKQAAITRQLAELGLRAQAMVVRPMQWFGCAAFASSKKIAHY